jgi:Flp pilus assembly protein TadB
VTGLENGELLMTAVFTCCAFGSLAAGRRGKPALEHGLCGLACAAETVLAVLDALGGQRVASAVALAVAAVWFWLWRRGRKNRKRSLRQLGHKARARLAAMIRNMPRPSPRLVPQGARA